MPLDPINLGSGPNTKTGDAAPTIWGKINTMFTELFSILDGDEVVGRAVILQEGGKVAPTIMPEDMGGQALRNIRSVVKTVNASRALTDDDKGCIIHMDLPSAGNFTLPVNWHEGDTVVVRQQGVGAISWALAAGVAVEQQAARATHTKITERYGEILVRCVRNNVGGTAAVYTITGETSA